jgi:hypothetical protein
MSDRTGRAIALLAAAATLGVAGDALRVWLPARLDVALWAVAVFLTALALIRAGALTAPPQARWLAAAVALVIPCLIWRDSPTLFAFNLVAIVGLLILAAPATAMQSLNRFGVSDLVRGGVWMGVSVAGGPIPAAVSDVRWADLPLTARTRRLTSVGLGLLAAVPVLFLFGSLLSEADPLFGKTMASILTIDMERVATHVVLTGLMAWAAAGLLRGGFWREGWLPPATFELNPRVPPATVLTFLGAIGVLFALFVGFQARELFLGPGEFQALTGTTVAEYARLGFFELVAVTALTLPMLLAADWLLDRQDAGEPRRLRWLTAALLVLLALMLASAYHRMLLYRSYYGLTEDRFYTLAFMTWLGVLLAWFAATVLRGRRSQFVPGAVLAALVALLALNIINPDAFIARANLGRAVRGASLDKDYLGRLSADAIPAIVDGSMALEVTERCALLQQLETRWGAELEKRGPSSTWNLARVKARGSVGPAWAAVGSCPPHAEVQGTDAKL